MVKDGEMWFEEFRGFAGINGLQILFFMGFNRKRPEFLVVDWQMLAPVHIQIPYGSLEVGKPKWWNGEISRFSNRIFL